MKIFLIGFMASGKTTVGKKLANKLDIPFVDLDAYIEEKFNTTIRTIMYNEGQDVFREKERDALEELVQKKGSYVLSTGGGTPNHHGNIDKMNKVGDTVYIELDIPTIVDRLMNSKKDRPLIWGKSEKDLTVYAKELLDRRKENYEKAKYTVQGRNLKIVDILKFWE